MIFGREDRKIKLSLSAKKAVIIGAAMAFVIAACVTFDALSARVTVRNGGSLETEILTFKSTVGEVLEQQGIELGKHDKLNCETSDRLRDNMTIEVYRAMQVYITAGGETKAVYTTKRVVEDILADAGYECTDQDSVTPKRTKIAKADTNIVLVKNTTEVVTELEETPYATTEKANASLAKGVKKVIQKGVCGQSEKTYRISYSDGVETGRELVDEVVITAPVAEITEVGTKATKADNYTIAYSGTVTTSRSGEISYSRVLSCVATAYDAVSCGYAPGTARTATGAIAQYGVVAVDPTVIPLGTRLYVDGYGYAVAADTGGAIKGNKIDLCFNTRSESLQYGRRNVNVYILN